jgi:hypothetical protein
MRAQHPTRGTIVEYHGSLIDYHGRCRVEGICDCRRCGGLGRYALTHIASTEPLNCVRNQSITPIGD